MKKVIVEVSARHLHLSQTDLAKLFGPNYRLKKDRTLSQTGEFAAKSKISLIGPKNTFPKVRIVGPVRTKTQVELSITDCWFLGIKPVLRLSGNLRGAAKLTIKGPKGSIKLAKAAIVAQRHLHISVKQAKAWGLKNKQKISAVIKGPRAVVFDNIIVRTGNFTTRLHLDTDEANAAGLKGQDFAYLQI